LVINSREKMAITAKDKLIRVSKADVFSNDGEYVEQRAQFSVTSPQSGGNNLLWGVIGFDCYYELYYHTQWDRPVLECGKDITTGPTAFFKVDVEDITVAELLRLFISVATGGAVTDFQTLEMWEPWAIEIDVMSYKEETVKESPAAQFTMVLSR
jgi:hypothetical protein